MKKEYIRFLDYCRAFTIVVILIAHNGVADILCISVFIIPLFFALSGIVYDPDKRTKMEYIKGRFRRLVVPFWCVTAMYTVVEAVRSHLLGYGTLKNLLTVPMYMLYGSSILPPATGFTQKVSEFVYHYPLADGRVYIANPSSHHLWFLPALFSASILFCILEEKTRKGVLTKVLAVAGLLALAYLDSAVKELKELPWALGAGAFGATCMLCGYWAKKYKLLEKGRGVLIGFSILGLALAVSAESLGSPGSAFISSYYGPYGFFSLFLTFAGGLGGAWIVILLMKGLDSLPCEHLKRGLSLMGKSTMEIYLFHMVFLFTFGYAFLKITGLPPQLDGWLLSFVPITPASTVFLVADAIAIAVLITFVNIRIQNKKPATK